MLRFTETMRRTLPILLALASWAAARGGEGPKPAPEQFLAELPVMGKPPPLARTCPILSRLALSDDLSRRVEELVAGNQSRQRELFRKGLAPAERRRQVDALAAELRDRIRALLNTGQQARYDAGWRIFDEFQSKVQEASRETQKAVRAAGIDPEKSRTLREAGATKVRDIMAERNRRLDEAVGEKPSTESVPAGQKVAREKEESPAAK